MGREEKGESNEWEGVLKDGKGGREGKGMSGTEKDWVEILGRGGWKFWKGKERGGKGWEGGSGGNVLEGMEKGGKWRQETEKKGKRWEGMGIGGVEGLGKGGKG